MELANDEISTLLQHFFGVGPISKLRVMIFNPTGSPLSILKRLDSLYIRRYMSHILV